MFSVHVPCHVIHHPGWGQNVSTFKKSPTLIYPCHFQGLRWRLTHVIDENSIAPVVKAMKFAAHVQYHMVASWPVYRGSPRTTLNNFLTPLCNKVCSGKRTKWVKLTWPYQFFKSNTSDYPSNTIIVDQQFSAVALYAVICPGVTYFVKCWMLNLYVC